MLLATVSAADALSADLDKLSALRAADWSGSFIGTQFAYPIGSSRYSFVAPGTSQSSGSLDLTNSFDVFKGTGPYGFGLSAGYNYMLPSRVVFGLEADVTFPNTVPGTATVMGAQGPVLFKETVLTSGTLRARLGYSPGSWLFYATGGFAWSYDQATLGSLDGIDGERANYTRLGTALGAGAELALSDNWSARFEHLYTDFGSKDKAFASGARVSSDLAVQSARLGLSYRLGGHEQQVLQDGLKPLETDRFSLHRQTTYLQQYAAPLRSPYSGPNSLAPNQTRETWDMTLYAGFKPWQGESSGSIRRSIRALA